MSSGNKVMILCKNGDCKACCDHHEECGGSVAMPNFITQQLQKQLEERKKFIIQLYQREEELIIKKLRSMRDSDVESYCFDFLGKELGQKVHAIYVK
jgi:hypothetical protein